jgi:hypothetical protein
MRLAPLRVQDRGADVVKISQLNLIAGQALLNASSIVSRALKQPGIRHHTERNARQLTGSVFGAFTLRTRRLPRPGLPSGPNPSEALMGLLMYERPYRF